MEKLDINDASGLLVPDVTEDSVDIYDGLDNIPSHNAVLVPDVHEDSVDIYDGLDINSSNNAENSYLKASQKDSMDLYEEIVAEEQQSRESSYSELKSRFQAAQSQIKELHKRLEQMELKNTGLNTENCRLKKNISALLRTARQEVTRKDAEIQRLNQQSDKGRYHHQFHSNNLRDQNSSGQTSTGRTTSRPPPSVPLPPPPPPSGPPPPLPPLPPSPPREERLSKAPIPPREDSKSSTYQPSESSRKLRSSSSSHHSESGKHKVRHSEEKWQSEKLSESANRRHKDGSDPNKDCNAPDKNRSHKADKDTGQRYDSKSCKNRNYGNVEGHRRSERGKSPPVDREVSSADKKKRSREQRQDTAHISISDSEQSAANSLKGVSQDNRKIHTSDGHDRRKKDWKKSSSNHHAERSSESSKERRGDRLSKDYQRKEDRRHEEEIGRKNKRSTPSESSREREKANAKVSNQGKVDSTRKERGEKAPEALKRSSEKKDITVKSPVKENSPNRKLCFMETLNLTLSPIKKPVLPMDAGQNELPPEEKVVDSGQDDESFQPNVEDMCVIDEVNSSELEDIAEQSSDAAKTESSEKVHKNSDNVKDVQESKQSETPAAAAAAAEQIENKSDLATSAHCKQPVMVEMQRTATTSPVKSSLKEMDITRNLKDKTKQAPDSQVDLGPQETTDAHNDLSGSTSEEHTDNSLRNVSPGNNTNESVALSNSVLNSSAGLKCGTLQTAVKKSLPMNSVDRDAAAPPPKENPVAEDFPGNTNHESKLISSTILPQDCQEQGLCPPASVAIPKKDTQDGPKDLEAVSSTISLESLPQEGLSLAEAIYVLTQNNEDTNDSSGITNEPSSSTGCIAVSKVSSTTEETPLLEKYSDLTFTPKKSSTLGMSHETNAGPSSSTILLHDEDSMMRTLSNLKRIPDAISPLRSPVRITKRSHLHIHGKPGHVKSLQKDFSSTATDANSKTLDVNKENKYPGSPAKNDTHTPVDNVSDLPSSLSETELEEGEIISESDDTAAGSPLPATKRAKLVQPARNKASPKSVLMRKSKERCIASKETHETAGVSTRSPKSRFKTVCPAATKASFSTIDEVMETFKVVRTEIRKKYMKLHKTFPKKSFYGVMDNFQESFLEFVDGAHFGQICSQAEELKSKLKKLIASVFSKVSNNGIVKRIFDQQAVDLKQRLWDFVDVQVDYLFKEMNSTLKSLCKPAGAQREGRRASGNEEVSLQPSAKTAQCQQKEAQSPSTNLNQTKSSAVIPYRTGLGSRGKDIRIIHVEKDRNVDPHPANFPKRQSVIDLHPPKNSLLSPEKGNLSSLVVPQNVSLLDKTDFELLTEQQASSLTFNLVRDTQMGEIFKCLLQGSDLLENGGISGDNTAWSLSTPRKDGERFLSITTPTKFDSPSKLLSPTKFDTPSKLIATWSGISPRKMLSPQSKDQIQLNPALFDESCLLEVPSEGRALLPSSLSSQRSYSILAEDLAVSLTIPSPLKSDSHLSFLQPSSMRVMSTPDSVISAHISEDALLDEEDASEQDIHLALDTDNSSCSSGSSEVLATPFVFKPDLPMQALVMEKSNDHFIVKIRQASTGADTTLTAEDSLSKTLTEEDMQHSEDKVESKDGQENSFLLTGSQNVAPLDPAPINGVTSENSVSGICQPATDVALHLTQDENLTPIKASSPKTDPATQQYTSKESFFEDSQNLKSHPKNTHLDNNLQNVQNSDHFFGHISQAASREDIIITAGGNGSQKDHREEDMTSQQSPSKAPHMSGSNAVVSDKSPHHRTESSETNHKTQASEVSGRRPFPAEDISSTPQKDERDSDRRRKRKSHQEKSKAKRSRKDEDASTEEMVSYCKNITSESKSSPTSLSPNSLYAKNVIRKKGEVVIAWTRDEDRAILIELKTKGASRETFSALSEKLNKPSEQIAHRFYQLMKLFKKQEKMDT